MSQIRFHPSALSASQGRDSNSTDTSAPDGRAPRWRCARFLVYGLVIATLVLVLFVEFARAGGPKYVAGTGYFNAGLAGQPITWAGGAITYYTDQGDLSPVLHGTDADAFVADAFTRWTTVSTAAVSATRAGQLAENVSGANVAMNADRSITMPADIQPTATATPLGIVYDADGAVTDALLGAGSSSDCFDDSAFGGPDAFTVDGHFAHALVIVNGVCVQTWVQVPDMKYHLVRVLGEVFGLGWSQLNLDSSSGFPVWTSDAKAGFPVMHQVDPVSCVPVAVCDWNADQPKADDQAALSRLYPVTSQNLGQFSGKQVLSATTGRIHGSVWFTDANGNPTQPMQGVNVIARWMDPNSGQPSGQYAISSVSGFLFSGNTGNPMTGYSDALGELLNRFGSTDATLEGFFDLAGLVTPSGGTAQYQLSVEGLDQNWSPQVGPYAPWQVRPSGAPQPIILSVNPGGDVAQDILMQGSARVIADSGEPSSYASPLPLPKSGRWTGALSPYGDVDYFSFSAHAGRTAMIDITTVDETGQTTEQKAQPVIGVWSLADPAGTLAPAYTTSPFNVSNYGLTRLNAQFLTSGDFRLGVADLRGDGRLDYSYRAQVLYGDILENSRASVRGSLPIEIEGIGFRPGMTVNIGSTNASLLAASSNELLVVAPPAPDGTQSVSITDPASGASVTLQDALTYGAGPNDMIRLTQSTNSATPVGGEAAYPIRVMVTTSDGSSPVGGATVQWSANNGATLTACNGSSTCTVLTDESGKIETRVDVGAAGSATVIAALAPASYSPAKFVQTSVSGTSSTTDLSLFAPRVWAAKGATVDVPLTTRLLSNGVPVAGKTINFQVVLGTASISLGSVTTDSGGYAQSTLHVPSLASDVQGAACLAPANNPCQSFYVLTVAPSSIRMENVSGSHQAIWVGQSFQPLWVRVTDSSNPPNPVLGATVTVQGMMFLPSNDELVENLGESTSSNHAMKVLLGSFQRTLVSDANGLVSMIPTNGGLYRPMDLELVLTTGTSAALQFDLQQLPGMMTAGAGASTGQARSPVGIGSKVRKTSINHRVAGESGVEQERVR